MELSKQVKYRGASLKDDNDIQRQVKSFCCAANKLRGTFTQCTTAVKNACFMSISCSVYLPIVEEIYSLVLNASALPTRTSTETCMTRPQM